MRNTWLCCCCCCHVLGCCCGRLDRHLSVTDLQDVHASMQLAPDAASNSNIDTRYCSIATHTDRQTDRCLVAYTASQPCLGLPTSRASIDHARRDTLHVLELRSSSWLAPTGLVATRGYISPCAYLKLKRSTYSCSQLGWWTLR